MPQNSIARIIGALAGLALALASHAGVKADPADLCLRAAADASRQSGVPLDVLLAVSIVETGRDGRPWPWTVNLGGEGHWLPSAQAAEALIAEALGQGRTNVDLGCFQLNYRWHAEAFASISDMLDPARNAAYAADYLARHHAETGDWAAAAAAYHSATPEHAERYLAKFNSAWMALGADTGQPVREAAPEHFNTFPLLIAGAAGSGGSLVPATSGGRRLIGGP